MADVALTGFTTGERKGGWVAGLIALVHDGPQPFPTRGMRRIPVKDGWGGVVGFYDGVKG